MDRNIDMMENAQIFVVLMCPSFFVCLLFPCSVFAVEVSNKVSFRTLTYVSTEL